MKRTRIAHLVFPRADPVRPVLGFVWDAIQAIDRAAPDLEVEVLVPVPLRALQRAQAMTARLRGRHKLWPSDLEDRLMNLSPRPTLIAYPPIPFRSIESAALAIGAHLALRAADRRPRLIQGSFLDEGGFAATVAARIAGAASMAVAHGTDVRAAKGELEGRAARARGRRAKKTIAAATEIITVSHHLAKELALLGRSADVVRYTTTRARFPEAPLETAHNPRTILFAGLISRSKGVDVLIHAFARLRHPHTALRLVGPEAGDVDAGALARKLGVAARVTLTGPVPQDALAAHYRDASIAVLPSLTEGYGIVLIEALLTGRPVVGSDVGGIREIIDDPRVGRLSPPGDPEALAEAIDLVFDGLEQGRYKPSALRAHALPMTFEEVGPHLAERTRRLLSPIDTRRASS